MKARAADLFTRLRRYRLRRPIDLALETEMRVWVGWDGNMPDGAAIDPRHPSLGWRWIGPDGAHPPGFAEDAIRPSPSGMQGGLRPACRRDRSIWCRNVP